NHRGVGGLPGVVLTAPARERPGQRITVATGAGPRRFVVTGVIRTAAAPALYAAGRVAAQVAGDHITAVALLPGGQHGAGLAGLAGQARAAVRGLGVRVLTGADRATAAPGPDDDLATVGISVLGTA